MDSANLDERFKHHAPKAEWVGQLHSDVREVCLNLANFLDDRIVDSREKSLAITHLEEVMMWSNAAIARHMNN